MASKHTANYQLNQWEATDKVQRTDFNADNAKLDAALGALAEAVERKAEASALASAAATIPKVAAGTYTGTGAATKTINVGFTPKAVLVMTQNGTTHSGNSIYGGLAVTGSPAQIVMTGRTFPGVSIEGTGFRVYYNVSDEYYKSYSNIKDSTYHYIAIG